MLIEKTGQRDDASITHYFWVFSFCGTNSHQTTLLSHFFFYDGTLAWRRTVYRQLILSNSEKEKHKQQ